MIYTNYVTAESSPPRALECRAEVRTIITAVAETGGVAAPWWERVVCARTERRDGAAIPAVVAVAYMKLFEKLGDLAEEDDPMAAAVRVAEQLLLDAMMAGAAPPRMSWHGGDSVVFIWSVGEDASYFTIGENNFSYLGCRDGEIEESKDDVRLDMWKLIFPLPHGQH